MAADFKRRRLSGLSFSNLDSFRQFALAYPALAIGQMLSGQFGSLAAHKRVQPHHRIVLDL